MIAPLRALRPMSNERPTYQWEPASGAFAPTLRLYGTLGRRELLLVVDAIAERARSPRDVVSVDFENVMHVDFRALPEFVQHVARHRHRGASIWLTGLSPYVRCLFDVAGQGAVVRQLAWEPEPLGRREPLRPF
jgi:ABC-type transporter Mla MlaB component